MTIAPITDNIPGETDELRQRLNADVSVPLHIWKTIKHRLNMDLNIDFESKVPLYYQLKEQIKQNILSGQYKNGDLIPSEREFSDNYELSSTTIRRALNDLVQENFLERKAGKGTFVRRRKVKRDLRKVLGFTKNMTEMGLPPPPKYYPKK